MKIKYRQGDVGLVKEPVPKNATHKPESGRVVLAYGEVTGHAHALAPKTVLVFEHEGTRWIRVPKKGAVLSHEEHGKIALAPGDYRVVIQREYTPEEIRNVKD